MINTISFEVARNRRDIDIKDSVLSFDETEFKKVENNIKQLKLKGWESELTVISLMMDALEDAVPESRVIPMSVTLNSLSVMVANGSKFDFWIIRGG